MSRSFNYEDVKCPHCGEIGRIRFTVEMIPFGSTTIKSEDPDQCMYCRNYFVGTVKTVYGARKLHAYEQKEIKKTKLNKEAHK